MVYYLHHLSPPTIPLDTPGFAHSDPELRDLSPIPSQIVPPRMRDFQSSELNDENHNPNLPSISLDREATPEHNSKPVLLLAGYSYGALITSLLPPILTSLLTPFQNPATGSAHAEIRLRSSSLAASQNVYLKTTVSSLLSAHKRVRSLYTDALTSPKLRKSTGGVRVGGEEDLRRASHDSYHRRSSFAIEAEEIVKKSVDRVRSIGKRSSIENGKEKRVSPKRQNTQGSIRSRRSFGGDSVFSNETDDGISKPDEKEGECKAIPGIGEDLQTAYLLVSPLQGFLHNLATVFSAKFSAEHEVKLTVDPTLAIFGDDDVFVSIKKLRAWSERLGGSKTGKAKGGSRFRYVEVSGAGHFWHDKSAVRVLQDEINIFVRAL
jgi:alpha/beta superfamily hydrolase